MNGNYSYRPFKRTIICGSRHITDMSILLRAIAVSGWRLSGIISGKAPGVDTLGTRYAKRRGKPLYEVEPNWDYYGFGGGTIRNGWMGDIADSCIAIPGPTSVGTWDMIKRCLALRIPIAIYKSF